MNLPINSQLYLDSFFYAVIFIACLSYLNRVHAHKFSHSLAFGLTAAGAFGSFCDLWSSSPSGDGEWHLMFRAGVAAIAVLHFGLDRRHATSPCASIAHDPGREVPPHTFERRFRKVQ